MGDIIADIQKALDLVEVASDKNPKFRYFCRNEEQKAIILEYDPSAEIVMLPKTFKTSDDEHMVYIIPTSKMNPIKIAFEGRTIEDDLSDYFESTIGIKPDKVEWDEEGLNLVASHTLTQKEKEELLKNIQYGMWEMKNEED